MNWNQRFIRFIYTKSYSSTSCTQYTSIVEYRLIFDVYVQAITFSPSIYTQILFESKPEEKWWIFIYYLLYVQYEYQCINGYVVDHFFIHCGFKIVWNVVCRQWDTRLHMLFHVTHHIVLSFKINVYKMK